MTVVVAAVHTAPGIVGGAGEAWRAVRVAATGEVRRG